MLTKTKTCWLLLAFLVSCTKATSVSSSAVDPAGLSGYASWYGKDFHGKKTASGEVYDMHEFTAAHRTLPFGTLVKVHRDNGRSVVVRINDRGPFVRGRVIDVSYAAAKDLGLNVDGVARVRLEKVGDAPSEHEYWVQIGSFRDKNNADQSMQIFQDSKLHQGARIFSEDGFYRLMVGPYPSEDAGHSARRALENDGHQGLLVRKQKR